MGTQWKWWLVALGWVLLLTEAASGQTVTALSFEPAATAEYSSALDRLILVSANPNLLHIYNPANNTDQTVALSGVPTALSVSPDGGHAAVGSASAIFYVNLQTAQVEKTFNVPAGGDLVLGPQYVYVVNNNPFSTPSVPAISVNLATAAQTSSAVDGMYGGRYDPATKAIYGSSVDSVVFKYDVSTGPIAGQTNGSIASCAPTNLSADFSAIYNGCGTVMRASTDATSDMSYVSAVTSGTNVVELRDVTASSSLNTIAAIPFHTQGPVLDPVDKEILLYTADTFNPRGQFLMPDFVVNGQAYQAHGKRLFYNSASSVLYALMQADSAAGLVNDYALFAIPLTNPPACSVTLGSSTAAISASGGILTSSLNAAATCEYDASSDSNWIVFSSGNYGSGNNTLTYLVRPNKTGGSRTGKISIGGSTLTVTQDGTVSSTPLNPLSIHVVAADYSSTLDKLIMVSAAPNEMHVYDPASQNDQIIPLAEAPLSVSVSPDGTHAVVGHNGLLSFVDLSALSVSQTKAVPLDASAVLLAQNNYAYAITKGAFGLTGFDAVQISTGVVTAVPGTYYVPEMRLSATGQYLYVSVGGSLTKFDISSGTPAALNSVVTDSVCGDFWLSQDGSRIYSSCGLVLHDSGSNSLNLTSIYNLPPSNWVADSSAKAEAAVVANSLLQIYSTPSLALLSQQSLDSFSVNGSSYAGSGGYAFWNKAASKLVVLEQADAQAGLLSDYGVLVVDESYVNPGGCTFSVGGSPAHISQDGGTLTFTVTASQPACSWTSAISADNPWLIAGATAAGTGSGSVSVVADPNLYYGARSGTITIAGQSVTVNQDASCTPTVTPSSAANFFSAGGSGLAGVTIPAGCPWTTSASAPWITITSGASGSGNGTIKYSVAPNATNGTLYGSFDVIGPNNQLASVTVYSTNSQQGTALRFMPVIPCRVADTRNPSGPFGGPILPAGGTREFDIPKSSCGIPSTAQAYALNLTVVPPGGVGYATVYPTGQALPLASTLNSDGRVKAAAAIVAAGTNGGISVYSSDATHVVIDVSGYFVPATNSSALAFYPLTPCRISDTRLATGPFGGPTMAAGETRLLPVWSSACNVPATALAYSLNYTVVPKKSLGFLATWPAGQTQPLVSTLNAPNTPTANAAIVQAGTTNGLLAIYTSDATDVIVDINGYFAPPAAGGLSLYGMPPCRVLDTRSDPSYGHPLVGTTAVSVAGYACDQLVPGNAQAFVVNTTVVPSTWLGYLSIWGDGQSQPLVSTLNSDGSVTSNLALAPTQYGGLNIYTSNEAQVILDLSGYFAP